MSERGMREREWGMGKTACVLIGGCCESEGDERECAERVCRKEGNEGTRETSQRGCVCEKVR